MKRLIKTLVLLAIIGGIMLYTCPAREKHVDKLTEQILESARDQRQGGEGTDIIESIGNAIVGSISEKVAHVYVDSQLNVDDYSVLNVGKMYYDGETRVVTIGAFNHVFCLVKAYDLLDEVK